METELTRKIKLGLKNFKPALSTKKRTIRYAEEVWTPTGIVDFIRFEDYIEKDYSFCASINHQQLDKGQQQTVQKMMGDKIGKCKIENKEYPNENCKGCVLCRRSYKIGMMITCYECKITVSDFKSPNGHNFHGNRNYYVIPKEIYESVKELVPKDIGIIVYNQLNNTYRIKKESEWKDISHELKERLLYDAFKKWVDKFDKN